MHSETLVRVDRQGMARHRFRIFPVAEQEIRLRHCARDVRIARVLVERSFELVQGGIPPALSAVHGSDKLESGGVVRPERNRALELSQGRLVLAKAIVMKYTHGDVRFG